MSRSEITNQLVVKRVEITGAGAIILTGPSSCGKGEVAKALCDFLTIPHERSLSMGGILRDTFRRAAEDVTFLPLLEDKYAISNTQPVLDSVDATPELAQEIERQRFKLEPMIAIKRGVPEEAVSWRDVSQLEWLEYCTVNGVLVPNRWTQGLIAAHIETLPQLAEKAFILDGYPRTVAAAEHLIGVLDEANVPVIKVLHLSISKQEMLHRAGLRQREDDTEEALLQRYGFYVEHVQPSIDYLKTRLGTKAVALIDAHQPHYDEEEGREPKINVPRSIQNVVQSALVSLGLPATSFTYVSMRPEPRAQKAGSSSVPKDLG